MAYNLITMDGINVFSNYFNSDLPISFRQYVALEELNRWHRLGVQKYKILGFKKQTFFEVNYEFLSHHLYKTTASATVEFPMISWDIFFFKINETIVSFCSWLDSKSKHNVYLPRKHYMAPFDTLINMICYYGCNPIKFNLPKCPSIFFVPSNYINNYLAERNVSGLNVFALFVFTIYFSFFFFSFFVKITKKMSGSVFFMQKFLKEDDQEVMSFEDIIVIFVFFLSFFINSLNLYTNSELIQYNIDMSFWFLFVYFFSLVVMVPASILFVAGENCFIYMKGTDKYNSLVSYIIFDIICILAFFLRFFLQVIRWCLFLTTYYMLHEYVFELAYSSFINYIMYPMSETALYTWLNSSALLHLVIHFARLVFEFFDTCLILTIQVTAFLAVILWLFNYLFSVSLDDIYESLFEDKLDENKYKLC